MVRRAIGAALLAASAEMAGAASAQGFSDGGSAGVAQARGLTASPGVSVSMNGDVSRVEHREPHAWYGAARTTDADDAPPAGLHFGGPLPPGR